MVGIILLLAALVLVLCIYAYQKGKRQQAVISTASNGVFDMNRTSNLMTDTSMMLTNTQSSGPTNTGVTLFPSNIGIAFPAYREVPFNSFVLLKQLAQGGGGQIYIAQAASSETASYGNELIVKVIASSREEVPHSIMELVNQEISILQLMSNNRHFPKFIGYCEKPVCILMKYYECGSLESYLKKPLRTSHKHSITSDIAQGLLALHMNHIAHCDLKPANVLLERAENGRLVAILTDFGIARIMSDEIVAAKDFNVVNLRGLSWQQAAPEVIRRFRGAVSYNAARMLKAGDVYAFAIIIYELLNRTRPW
jgi:serine/threonine protein kinase